MLGGVSQPHNDPLVVTLVISNYLMYRIVIDNGNSANILYHPTFDQMGVERDKLRFIQTLLVGFTSDRLLPLEMVSLSITAGTGD